MGAHFACCMLFSSILRYLMKLLLIMGETSLEWRKYLLLDSELQQNHQYQNECELSALMSPSVIHELLILKLQERSPVYKEIFMWILYKVWEPLSQTRSELLDDGQIEDSYLQALGNFNTSFSRLYTMFTSYPPPIKRNYQELSRLYSPKGLTFSELISHSCCLNLNRDFTSYRFSKHK